MAEDIKNIPETEIPADAAATAAADDAKSYDPEGFFTPRIIRHNMMMVILAEAVLMTGSKDLGIAMTPLLNYLTDSYAVMGFIQFLMFAAVVGAIATPYITRRFPYKKWYYVTVSSAWASIPIVLGLGLIFARLFMTIPADVKPGSSVLFPLLCLTVGCYTVLQILGGFTTLPHNEYLASCIPPSYRGRMYGISSSLYSALSIAATYIGYLILDKVSKPGSYGYIFVMTGVIWLAGFIVAVFAIEKRTPVEKSPKPWTGAMLKAFWHDKAYLNFIIFSGLSQMSFVPIFWMLPNFGLKELGMADKTVPIINGIGLALTIVTAPPSGWLIDKLTPKRTIPMSMLTIGVGYLLFYFFYRPYGLYLSFSVLSIAFMIFFPSGTILSVSIPKPEHRGGHFAILVIVNIIATSLGLLLTGLISDAFKSEIFIKMLDVIHLNYDWLKGPRLLMLLTALWAFVFYFMAKRLFRVLGDSWKTYS